MYSLVPKVLMFGWEFPPHNSGGLGVACHGLTRSLASLGAGIIFVLPKNLGYCSDFMAIKCADATRRLIRQNVRYEELNVFLYPYLTESLFQEKLAWFDVLKRCKHAPYAKNLYEEVLRYAALSQDIALDEKFDIIHAHDWLSFPAGVEAKKLSGKKLVAHVHATELDRCGGQGVNPQVFEIEKYGLEQADKVVAVSNLIKESVHKQYDIDREKIEVIRNGIDCDYFQSSRCLDLNRLDRIKAAGYSIVLSLGRITIQKGLDNLVNAARKVLDHEKKVMFLFVGAGDMQAQLMRQAASLRISDKTIFTGWLKGDDLAQAYRAADLFIMPSVSEPFGLTVLESMLNETPVIASKQSGASEVTHNILKVDFWDTDEMANQILSVIRYGSLKKTLSVNARAEVNHLNWTEPAQKCLNLYRRLILNTA